MFVKQKLRIIFLIILSLIFILINNKIIDENKTNLSKFQINSIISEFSNIRKINSKPFSHHSKSKRKKKKTKTQLVVINDYKLYDEYNNPFITVIFNFSKVNVINETFINFLEDSFREIHKNTQIILLHTSSNNFLKNNEISKLIRKKRIEIHKYMNNNYKDSFLALINRIKGRFFILLDKVTKFNEEEFSRIYNTIKGTIRNIFKIDNQQNTNSYYLIRTKIVKDIIDSEKIFYNFNDIINLILSESNIKFNYVPIVYCPNNYYTSLTYTSMISVLVSKQLYTYILFYLIITFDFKKKNIELIESLYEQFDYFNITFIKMDNRYEKASSNRYISKNAYYRLSIGELLPNLNKVIYLDSDTICLKDLTNLYNLNFLGKMFLAKINTFNNKDLSFSINSGVLLLNLDYMRIKKVEHKVLTLLNNGFNDPVLDQAIINIYFKEYIGFLPTEYNTFTFSYDIVKKYYKETGGLYDFDSLYFSFKYPSIIHYRGHPSLKTYNKEDWYYFARQSKYFLKRSHNFQSIFNFSLNL